MRTVVRHQRLIKSGERCGMQDIRHRARARRVAASTGDAVGPADWLAVAGLGVERQAVARDEAEAAMVARLRTGRSAARRTLGRVVDRPLGVAGCVQRRMREGVMGLTVHRC